MPFINLCHFWNFASEKNCSFSLVFSQPQKSENPILALLMVNINMLGEKTQWTVGHFCQCVVALWTHGNILSLLTLYNVKFTLFFWMKVKKIQKNTKELKVCQAVQSHFKSKLSGDFPLTFHCLSHDSLMTSWWVSGDSLRESKRIYQQKGG